MKKLLFIAALTMLGANVFAAEPTGSVTVPVEVKAQLTDDTFSITDIDGKELYLDFGKVSRKAVPDAWTAKVEYKITAEENGTKDTEFAMKLANDDLILKHENNSLADQLIANLGLDAATKVMLQNETVTTGAILGNISKKSMDAIKTTATGKYHATTYLTATVTK